ncbi:MAG: IS66 family insertion sequence element accessory protein TnpA [Methylobacter sp.]
MGEKKTLPSDFCRGDNTALPTHWQHHIEAWQASTLPQAAYCWQYGLNPNTYSGRWHHF